MQANGPTSPMFHLRGRAASAKILQRSESDSLRSPTADSPLSPSLEQLPTPEQWRSSPRPPPAGVFVEAYRTPPKSAEDAPSRTRVRSSALLNVSDPVAMHLLVETAIDDSRNCDVLSFGELENVKKEHALTLAKIESVRRKLAMENKVKEAAQSLHRLYLKKGKSDKAGGPRPRRNISFAGNHGKSGSNASEVSTFDKAEDELAASTRKCDELATELWKLDTHAMNLQGRLWQHTAGILQMTHKGPAPNRNRGADHQSMWPLLPQSTTRDAPPGSPVSMYTYDNARDSGMVSFGDDRGHMSLYIQPEEEAAFADGGQPNSGLETQNQSFLTNDSDMELQRQEFERQNKVFAAFETKLHHLNRRLGALLVQANPERYQSYPSPPAHTTDSVNVSGGSGFENQFDYLERTVSAVGEEQEGHLQQLRGAEAPVERFYAMNARMYSIISSSGMQSEPPYPPPPDVERQGTSESHISYLEESLFTLQQLHEEMVRMLQDSSSIHTSDQERAQQQELVIGGLWDFVSASEEAIKLRNAERAELPGADTNFRTGSAREFEDPTKREFSLEAFSAKVQWLCQRTSRLAEQKDDLHRQVQQQREIDGSHTERNLTETDDLRRRLQSAVEERDLAEIEVRELRAELGEVLDQLDMAKQQHDFMVSNHEISARDLETRAAERDEWQKKGNDLKFVVDSKQERIDSLENTVAELEEKARAIDASEETIQSKDKKIADLENRMREADKTHRKRFSTVAAELQSKLQALHISHDAAISRSMEIQDQHDTVRAHYDEARARVERLQSQVAALTASESEATARAADLYSQLSALGKSHDKASERITDVESQLSSLDASHTKATSRATDLQSQLSHLQTAHEEKSARAAVLESELRDLESEVVRLQTELTVARADLDGEYGSRAQRAAIRSQIEELEQRNAALTEELEALRAAGEDAVREGDQVRAMLGDAEAARDESGARVNALQTELQDIVGELAGSVAEGVRMEREREGLEAEIDRLRAQSEEREERLEEERVRHLGQGSEGGGHGAVNGDSVRAPMEGMSVGVLRVEFKKLMRDSRAEFSRALKAEHEERKKLEATIRALRREQANDRNGTGGTDTAA